MNVDLDKLTIVQELGAGFNGTTYVVKSGDKQYALKIQPIFKKGMKESFKNELWRELDFYKFISKLKPEERQFFTELYQYRIINNCKHKQKRGFILDEEVKKQIAELDKSPYCLQQLLELKSGESLLNHLKSGKRLPLNSIMLQIMHIAHIAYLGGYSHNDLHSGNIIITPTTKSHFKFWGHKVPFEGYKLSAIDYGEVLHKKFKGLKWLHNHEHSFYKNRKRFLFVECYFLLYLLILNDDLAVRVCKDEKRKLPWERSRFWFCEAISKMYKHDNIFFNSVVQKYTNAFPKYKQPFGEFMAVIGNIKKMDAAFGELFKSGMHIIVYRIIVEYYIKYPDFTNKAMGFCGGAKMLMSNADIRKWLMVDDFDSLVEFALKRAKLI